MALLDEDALQGSETVANAAMNRGRGLSGVNSYARELRLDVLAWLRSRSASHGGAAWLDPCCGEGRALVEAARELSREGTTGVSIVGVDLMPPSSGRADVSFVAASAHEWRPAGEHDLITCVHGLHYVGDKLGLIGRIARWLRPDGLFLGNLDLEDIRSDTGRSMTRSVLASLRERGVQYGRGTRVLRIDGRRRVELPFRFLGAEDAVGANYTGQPTVHSFYAASRPEAHDLTRHLDPGRPRSTPGRTKP